MNGKQNPYLADLVDAIEDAKLSVKAVEEVLTAFNGSNPVDALSEIERQLEHAQVTVTKKIAPNSETGFDMSRSAN